MTPVFKYDATDRVYVTEKYFTNGHYLLDIAEAKKCPCLPKSLKAVLDLGMGSYTAGTKRGKTSDTTPPSINSVIPSADGYLRLMEAPARVKFRQEHMHGDEIIAYVFQVTNPPLGQLSFDVGISPKYVPLLRLGSGWAKDSISPIRVCDNDGALIAVVMPVRIGGKVE